jgi:hypothetical protein
MTSRRFSIILAMAIRVVAFGQQGQAVAGYQLLKTINLPGGISAFDISWVDPSNARYYVADRGNTTASPPIAPRIDVIDTLNNQYVSSITLPAAGNGVLAVPRAHELWVGLNDSTVAVIDTNTSTITHVISTGGKMRADEMAYDPADRVIVVANDRDTPPFVSFISQQTYSVLATLNFDGVSAPKSTGGLEQSVWDEARYKFYLAVPATAANPNGEIDELDPQTFTVNRSFPTNCKGPAGLVLIPAQRLMTSCGDILDIASGKVLTTVSGVGGDEIWYNAGDQRVYFGGGTDRISISVVDASVNASAPITALVVGQILTAPAVSQTTHSVAADSANNEILVPVSGVGVQIWRNGASLIASPNPIPIPATAQFGSALISWNAPNAQVIEIHVGSPNGVLFAEGGNRGSAPTGLWVDEGTTFYLQDVTKGLPLTAANTLATLVMHLQKM